MEQNLNLYHIFVTVARCKNISGAARALYISQPAISKAISRLEQNLNTTLFLRSSRGVKLTEAGEILYRQVESAFLAINQGEQQLKKMQELGIGHLSIGASSTLCKYVLLPYLRTFTEENPHIQIGQKHIFAEGTAGLSAHVHGGKPAHPDFHLLPVHLPDGSGDGKRIRGYRSDRRK